MELTDFIYANFVGYYVEPVVNFGEGNQGCT